MQRTTTIVIITLAVAAVCIFGVGRAQAVRLAPAAEYNPEMNPTDFTTTITNPFFFIPVGKKMIYQSQTEDGLERVEVLVPGWTKKVLGVETLVFWDRVWVEGQLVEDTRDYLAQHTRTGDVWYFGEHVDNYENGVIKDHAGAWLAGVAGAKPGIWMLANPQVGDEFRNEYSAGQAEDSTKILATNETVTAPLGTYTNCVKTLDWSPLSQATANKYYCTDVGGTALEVDLEGPETPLEQRSGLVSIDPDGALGAALPSAYASEGVAAAVSSNTNINTTTDNKKGVEIEDRGNDWLPVLMSGIIGVLLGAVIQRLAFRGRRPETPRASK